MFLPSCHLYFCHTRKQTGSPLRSWRELSFSLLHPSCEACAAQTQRTTDKYPESLPHPVPTTPNHCEMWYNSGTVWSLLPAEHEHPLPLQPYRVKTTTEKEKGSPIRPAG